MQRQTAAVQAARVAFDYLVEFDVDKKAGYRAQVGVGSGNEVLNCGWHRACSRSDQCTEESLCAPADLE